MHVRTLLRLLAALLALTLVAAACGDDDDGESSESSDTTTTAAEATDETDESDTAEDTDDEAAEDDEAEGDGAAPAGPPAETDGFDGETITLGFLTDQSGSLSILGVPLLAGSQAYWDSVNAEGGVAGMYPVEFETGDTKDEPATTVTEYQRLKDDVVMFAEVLSTPPTQALLEFLEEDNIVAVPGSLAGAWAGERRLLPNGTAYQYEMINLADWFVNESGLGDLDSVACSVAVDDLYGEEGMAGLEYAADALGFELVEKATIARGDTDFTALVGDLNGAGCEVVYAVTVATEQNGILGQALGDGFEPVWLGALPSYISLFAGGAPDRYENFYVALDSPDFNDVDVPGMAAFVEGWETHGTGDPANTFHLSGWFQQISVHALLEKAIEMGDLSREGIEAAMADLGEVDVMGLGADNYIYGLPEDRVPVSASRVFQFDANNPPNLLTEIDLFDSELNADFPLF